MPWLANLRTLVALTALAVGMFSTPDGMAATIPYALVIAPVDGAWHPSTRALQHTSVLNVDEVVMQLAVDNRARNIGRFSMLHGASMPVNNPDTQPHRNLAPALTGYGLRLPEPGAGSAILATIALVAFFIVRRPIR